MVVVVFAGVFWVVAFRFVAAVGFAGVASDFLAVVGATLTPVGCAAVVGVALMAGFVVFVPTLVTGGFEGLGAAATEVFESFDVVTEGLTDVDVVVEVFEGFGLVSGFFDVVVDFLVAAAFLIVALTRRSST